MSRPLHVLARGRGWIVVAKPPNFVTHRGPDTLGAPAALQSVRDMVGRPVYPIHRLDRPASGCLLFATEAELAGPLSAAFTTARKTYLAFVRGHYRATTPVVVDNPMKDDNGYLKDARSVVTRLGGADEPRCSLLAVFPETGRYHQVRRHVRDLNHPVIADRDHGDSRVNRWWREVGEVDRLGLHAFTLEVDWEEPIRAVCPLFVDQHRVFVRLPWWAEALAAEPRLGLEPLPMRVRRAPPPPPAAPTAG